MYNLNFKYICNFFTIFLFQLIFIKIKSNNDKFKLIDESGAEQGQETLAMCYYLGYKYYDGKT